MQQLFEVDPLARSTCRGPMRIVAFITQASVIDQILAHLRARAATAANAAARSPPSTQGPPGPIGPRGDLMPTGHVVRTDKEARRPALA